MSDLSLPVMAYITLSTLLASLAGSWGVLRYQSTQNDRRIAAIEADLRQQRIELAAFKLEAAQRFVTDEMMAKLEERVIGAIDRLADRLDRIIENRVSATRRGNPT